MEMKNFFVHCYHAIRYGKWYFGWESYKDKPILKFTHQYYDGDMVEVHLYKLWVGVSY